MTDTHDVLDLVQGYFILHNEFSNADCSVCRHLHWTRVSSREASCTQLRRPVTESTAEFLLEQDTHIDIRTRQRFNTERLFAGTYGPGYRDSGDAE